MCGEKALKSWLMSGDVGSPPRMRGKGPFARVCVVLDGITPAYAGKRSSKIRSCRGSWDHPRVCREKLFVIPGKPEPLGSPPHVRGKGQGQGDGCDHQGITPACAGKRCRSPAFRSMPWDHPRVCGEKLLVPALLCRRLGSPPRVRGKVSAGKILLHDGGITPAYAGKSSRNETCWHRPWDHPRVYGEKLSCRV